MLGHNKGFSLLKLKAREILVSADYFDVAEIPNLFEVVDIVRYDCNAGTFRSSRDQNVVDDSISLGC